jgi:hypothetical protein
MLRPELGCRTHDAAPVYTSREFSEMQPARSMIIFKLLRIIWIPKLIEPNHHNT